MDRQSAFASFIATKPFSHTMIPSFLRRAAQLGAFLGALAGLAQAQDSGALLNVLVRKGILTDQEAEDIRAELTAESHAAVVSSISGGKSTHSLAISGRLQAQYAGADSDAAGIDRTNQFFIRRMYLGVKASLGAHWSAHLVHDLANEGFDRAYLEYLGNLGDTPFAFDVGLRKVNFGMEEWTSSGSLPAIERSGVTRYFVESNNGRRLEAGSYRVGLFFDGNPDARLQKRTGVFYSFAVTNPERAEGVEGARLGSTKSQAYWANVGYSGAFGGEALNTYMFGVAAAHLADVGGRQQDKGSDIAAYNVFGTLSFGNFRLAGEYLAAEVEDGLGVGAGDASPWGVWVQPSYMVNEKFEIVGRYSYTDSDGRGIKVSDGVRSAPASLTGDNLTELYLGFNYYIVGQDLKLQFGFIRGTAKRGAQEETADGIRSQMQVSF